MVGVHGRFIRDPAVVGLLSIDSLRHTATDGSVVRHPIKNVRINITSSARVQSTICLVTWRTITWPSGQSRQRLLTFDAGDSACPQNRRQSDPGRSAYMYFTGDRAVLTAAEWTLVTGQIRRERGGDRQRDIHRDRQRDRDRKLVDGQIRRETVKEWEI